MIKDIKQMSRRPFKLQKVESDYWRKWFNLVDALYARKELLDAKARFSRGERVGEVRDIEKKLSTVNAEIASIRKEIRNIERRAEKEGVSLRLRRVMKKFGLSEDETIILVALLKSELEEGFPPMTRGAKLLGLLSSDYTERIEKLSLLSPESKLAKHKLISTDVLRGSPLHIDFHLTEKAVYELLGFRMFQEKEWEGFEEFDEEWRPEPPAHFVKPSINLENVVLPETIRENIRDVLSQFLYRNLIFDKWGFGEKILHGKGVVLLFYGPPGTGKTMTAEAVAGELKKELAVVRYERLEDYLVGMTEKNIARVFEEASQRDAVILFDEADALLSERSARNAKFENREVNVLLQHIENYDGVVVLTTNFMPVLDWALERRISLKVEFCPPEYEERKEIFRRHIPSKAPISRDVDIEKLAQFKLTGGEIKNVVLNAARRAARMIPLRGEEIITYEDFMVAIKNELEKKEREKKRIGFEN